jgi:hypothetical protein
MSDVDISVTNVKGLQDEEPIGTHSEMIASGRDYLVRVDLGDGNEHHLSRSDPNFELWHPFLVRRVASKAPVYVETDKQSRLITEILAPSIYYVEAVSEQPVEGLIEVVLLLVPTANYLSTDHPHFDELLNQLRAAVSSQSAVLVTIEPLSRQIVDIRDPEQDADPSLPMPNGGVVIEAMIEDIVPPPEVALKMSTISIGHAVQEFDDLRMQPKIPFDYPWDCCTARAHEMCNILKSHGLKPQKIWNYGSGFSKPSFTLKFVTNLDSDGFVLWRYHVAPLLEVFLEGERVPMVFDPAMFDGPVSIDDWVAKQNDADATQEFSDPTVAFLFPHPDDRELFTTDMENDAKLEKHRYERDLIKLKKTD